MSVLSDKWIKKMSSEEDMIFPFEEKQIRGDSNFDTFSLKFNESS